MIAPVETKDRAPAAVAPSPNLSRDDVPWQPAAWSWLRKLAAARFALFLPLAGGVLWCAVGEILRNPTAAFLSILIAAAGQAVALRLGGSSHARPVVTETCLAASLLLDVILLSFLAAQSGGAASPFVAALVLPAAAGIIVMNGPACILPAAVALAAGLVLGSPAFDGDRSGGTAPLPRGVREVGQAAVLVAAAAAAFWLRRRQRYLERRIVGLDGRGVDASRVHGGDAASRAIADAEDWEELGAISTAAIRSSAARITAPADGPLATIADQLALELRDPAGAIRARAESLRYELRDRARRDDLLPEIERLLRAADRLDDVRLTLATLAGAAAARDAECDPRSLALELRAAFTDDFDREGVKLRVEAPRSLPHVAISHNELRLVLVRLLDAARRAAVAHGRNSRVTARFSVAPDGVSLEVEDNLPLPAVNAAAEMHDEKRPGLGLALSVARLILDARGGSLDVLRRTRAGLTVRVSLRRALR